MWTLCEESRPALVTRSPGDPGGCVSGVCGARRMPEEDLGLCACFLIMGAGPGYCKSPSSPPPSLSPPSCSGLCF